MLRMHAILSQRYTILMLALVYGLKSHNVGVYYFIKPLAYMTLAWLLLHTFRRSYQHNMVTAPSSAADVNVNIH